METIAPNFFNAQSDAILVLQYQSTGNEACFNELYHRYSEKVNRYCLKSLGNQCDASDMVQEIFLKVLEKINTLKDPDLWVAWLFRIAHNKVINLHKKQSLHRMDALQEGMPEPRTENEIAEKLEIERKLSALPELLQEMPDQQAKVLRLKYLDGQSIETLCEELHIKESAVKMRLLRARTQIVKMYEERYRTSA